MFNFNYFTPTKVVFGKETENKVADLIREFGGEKGSAKVLNEKAMPDIYRESL